MLRKNQGKMVSLWYIKCKKFPIPTVSIIFMIVQVILSIIGLINGKSAFMLLSLLSLNIWFWAGILTYVFVPIEDDPLLPVVHQPHSAATDEPYDITTLSY